MIFNNKASECQGIMNSWFQMMYHEEICHKYYSVIYFELHQIHSTTTQKGLGWGFLMIESRRFFCDRNYFSPVVNRHETSYSKQVCIICIDNWEKSMYCLRFTKISNMLWKGNQKATAWTMSQDLWEKEKKQHLGSTLKPAKTTKIKLKYVPLVCLVITKLNEETKH